MPEQSCPQCDWPVEEQELLCGHCGNALIPQLTRIELQRLTEAERNRYFQPFSRGLGIGLLFGGLVVGLLIVTKGGIHGAVGTTTSGAAPGPGWLDLTLLVLIAILGGMAGLMQGLITARRAKPPTGKSSR